MKRSATVEFFGSQKSCFAVITWPLFSKGRDSSMQVLKIETSSQKCHYVSVIGSGGTSSKQGKDVIKLNSRFGTSLGLQNDEIVTVTEISVEPSVIQTTTVTCVSSDDWEILESNAEIVTYQLLNQLRVVYPGLHFPFWVTKSMSINLKIDNMSPSSEFGILAPQSEIVIPALTSTTASIPLSIKNYLRLRVHPVSVSVNALSKLPSSALVIKNIHHAFVHRSSISNDPVDPVVVSEKSYFSATLFRGDGKSSNSRVDEQLVIKVFLISSCDLHPSLMKLFPVTNPSCIYLHPELIKKQNFVIKSYLWMKQVDETALDDRPSHFSQLENTDFDQSTDFRPFNRIIEESSNFIEASLSLGTINHRFIGPEHGSILIEGKAGSGKTWLSTQIAQSLEGHPNYVHWELVNCAKWRGKKPETIEKELKSVLEEASLKKPSIVILDDLDVLAPVAKSEQQNVPEEFLHYKICETFMDSLMHYKEQQLTFICTAVGKEGLNSYWKSRPGFHFFHKTVTIPSPNQLERLAIFQKCIHRYQTSAASTNTKTNSANNTVITKDLLFQSESPNNSQTQSKIKTVGFGSGSRGGGKSQADYDLELRSQLEKSLSSIHDQYATPQLIHNLARKWAIHLSSLISKSKSTTDESSYWDLTLLGEFIQDEIKFCEDGIQKGSQSRHNKPISWDSIGGLHGAKDELTKILQWPIKYAKLFKNSPIKLPSGILLYGYPGTGKTLMGLSISSIVNAKFIHIKGPELLSKYIGASEQAVQDVFKRARNSSPCIIFFDEFDSLVPRRGHDSTGVTDRVVNQFLSEMDGIEGGLGEGVYLIGATSRPDLIDPAVLRPGRLDRHLFFDLPDAEERREIMGCLSRDVNLLVDESDLDEISRETEGYTGADIHSLVFSSQLAAVQRYLDKLELNETFSTSGSAGTSTNSASFSIHKETTSAEVPVTKEDLKEILSDFKPSLQGNELKKFKYIYDNFSGSKISKDSQGKGTTEDSNGGTGSGTMIIEAGKRATLA